MEIVKLEDNMNNNLTEDFVLKKAGDGGKILVKCKRTGEIVIPDELNITEIGSGAFKKSLFKKNEITKIESNTVKTVKNAAFKGCSSLKTASFPKLETIEAQGFDDCVSLESVDFPKVKTLGRKAFDDCSKLVTVSFPELETIGVEAFDDCLNLENVNFPKVKTVKKDAFKGCIRLKNMDFLN